MQSPGPESWHPNPDFLFQEGAGPLFDIGPYYLTALVQLFGPVARVSAAASKARETRVIGSGPRAGEEFAVTVPTHVSALYEFESGQTAQSVFSFDSKLGRTQFEVAGLEGTLVVPDPNTFEGDLLVHGADGIETAAVARVRPTAAAPASSSWPGRSAPACPSAPRASRPTTCSTSWSRPSRPASRGTPVEVESTVDGRARLPEDWDPRAATLASADVRDDATERRHEWRAHAPRRSAAGAPAVAIVGGGFMAEVHSRAARAARARARRHRLVDAEKLGRGGGALGIERAYGSLDELLADDAIDVVHVCTPNALHAEQAAAVLAAGKHVVCEKPLATTVADAEALVARRGRPHGDGAVRLPLPPDGARGARAVRVRRGRAGAHRQRVLPAGLAARRRRRQLARRLGAGRPVARVRRHRLAPGRPGRVRQRRPGLPGRRDEAHGVRRARVARGDHHRGRRRRRHRDALRRPRHAAGLAGRAGPQEPAPARDRRAARRASPSTRSSRRRCGSAAGRAACSSRATPTS